MADFAPIYQIYGERLELEVCYTQVSEETQGLLGQSVRRFGLRPFESVAQGVLAFCMDGDNPVCLPWLVAPDAPERDLTGGRHGFVLGEFDSVSGENGLSSYTHPGMSRINYDDYVRTYVVKNTSAEEPTTVICESLNDHLAKDTSIELVQQLSQVLTDHQFLVGIFRGDGNPTAFMRICTDSIEELTFGSIRGVLDLDTIASPSDTVGQLREIESYAKAAKRNGLQPLEFAELVVNAVGAFRDSRQVSLDSLCKQIIAGRTAQS